MKYGLYHNQDSILVVLGIFIFHFIAICLSAFFCYRFMWLVFDPSVLVLLLVLWGAVIVCDYSLSRVQGLTRFLIRCNVDADGLRYGVPFGRLMSLRWDKIRRYGILGFDNAKSYVCCYVSTESVGNKRLGMEDISENFLIFQVDTNLWHATLQSMPMDMCSNLTNAVSQHKNMVFTRK